LQAAPTIIEDDCFLGARSEVVEGVVVERGSVLGMGVCQVTITLTRLAEAAYPASLAAGGNATAIVKRRLVINSI
jgi:2,3,4,5-tetrahydropyridine-2,6-dicarboxylate N-succinyltransferase